MRRAVASIALTLALASILSPRTARADDVVRTPDHASYTVDLSARHGGRSWTGAESIAFENTGTQALDLVYVRLWANGPTGCSDPAIVVSNVTGGTAGDLAVACSALPIALDTPLAPGETSIVGMDLRIRLPAANDRFGWFRHTGRLGNALPILAVNDDEGWHLDPYFASGESFYSLVSDWQVTLDVPSALATPATGTLTDETASGDGRDARTYVASDVRDFAWEIGPFAHVVATSADGVRVRLWYVRPLDRARAAKLVRRSASILDTFSAAFGEYPYPEMDVVITTFDSFGGMEYPQLVMAVPEAVVISHELAHQWWYGIVGDDEYEDPWIDEGFAQWSMYLPFHGPRGWPPDPFTHCAMFTWPDQRVRVSSGVDYFDAHPEDYFIPYYQGACALANVAAELGGLQPFLRLLHDYAAAHWLGVSTNADVMAAIEQTDAQAGNPFDAAKFFDRWRISRP